MEASRNRTVCECVDVAPLPPKPGSKVGFALSTIAKTPINGLRVMPTEDTNGWYIWCGGEMSQEPKFFLPVCLEHLPKYAPLVIEYLELPPGYRFQIDHQDYKDVWYDPALLDNNA